MICLFNINCKMRNLRWTVVVLVALSAGVLGSDFKCKSQTGHCRMDSYPCTGGGYHSGLCSGPSNRRCCITRSSGHVCGKINIISRATWGAMAPKSKSYVHNPLGMFFIHHTVTPGCYNIASCSNRVREIQRYHMKTKGWYDIGYSFLVGGDGKIYEGRGWDREGAHTYDFNRKGYAASFIGDFRSHSPTGAAIQATKDLIACGVKLGKLSSNYKLYGHRQAGSTICPGKALFTEIKKWPHWTAGHA